MSKSWYSRSQDIEYKDGHIGKEYHLVFETTDKKLARRIEKIFQNIMDGIEPERKNGMWIEHNPHKWGLGIVFECSECGEKIDCEPSNYCPNCGAEMEKPE